MTPQTKSDIGKEVAAILVSDTDLPDNDTLPATIPEIDRELRTSKALRRAVLIGERERLYKLANPDIKNGGDRKSSAFKEKISFQKLETDFLVEINVATGLNKSSIYRSLSISRLSPDILSRLAPTALADSEGELYTLSRLEPRIHGDVVEAMLRDQSPAPSVTAARDEIAGKPPKSEKSKDDADLLKLQEVYSRASKKTRDAFDKWREAQG